MSTSAGIEKIASSLDSTHLFIGAMAILLSWESTLLFLIPTDAWFFLLIGAMTTSFYCAHRLQQIRSYQGAASKRMTRLYRDRIWIKWSLITSLVVSAALIICRFSSFWMVWLGIGIASMFYLLPLIRGWRIRDFPFIKIFCIAGIWTGVTVLLVQFVLSTEWSAGSSWMIAERVVFFLMLTLPFDVRDHREDRAVGLSTLGTQFNLIQIRRIEVALFAIYLLIVYLMPFDWSYKIALVLISTSLMVGIHFIDEKTPWYYFSFVLDGMIGSRVLVFLILDLWI